MDAINYMKIRDFLCRNKVSVFDAEIVSRIICNVGFDEDYLNTVRKAITPSSKYDIINSSFCWSDSENGNSAWRVVHIVTSIILYSISHNSYQITKLKVPQFYISKHMEKKKFINFVSKYVEFTTDYKPSVDFFERAILGEWDDLIVFETIDGLK